MKKILLFSVLGLCINAAHAQFGVQAGASFYSAKEKFSGYSFTYDTKVGFTAGLVYNAQLTDAISFMPSLNFTQKGGKLSESGDDVKFTLNYIDLPLNFVYNINGFFIGAGPALGFGVGGKVKETTGGMTTEEDINFGSGDDDSFKPFEFSANILAGYKLNNGLFITANYNPGLSNIANDDSGDGKFHNHGFAIRLGYMFGSMKKTSSPSAQ